MFLLIAVAVATHAAVPAQLRMPSFISDNMVLQRGNATVWGWVGTLSSIFLNLFFCDRNQAT
jgi:hypothetical protein